MLVFVSDLHFCDETAGVGNIPPAAFDGALRDLAAMARDAHAQEVALVFLGDTFDLIRTEAWFQVALPDRPWGTVDDAGRPAGPGTEQAALDLFEEVVRKNRPTFDMLGGDLAARYGFPENTRRVYVPGNHDRLCDVYPRLRERVRQTLGIPHDPPDAPFSHYFMDEPHATFGRHGCEWDAFNFEGSEGFSQFTWEIPPEDYHRTPIGDVIACEFYSRIPVDVMQRLPDGIPPEERDRLQKNLRDIFDVRPLAAVMPWLAYQVQCFDDPRITKAVNEGLGAAIHTFAGIPFVQAWLHKHDRWLNPFDPADQLQWLIYVLERVPLTTLQKALPYLERFTGLLTGGDNFASRAAEDFRRLDQQNVADGKMQYVLYGHTHQPDQRAIDALESGCDRVYLNTGMWRPAHHRGVTSGFVTWKNLVYTVLYRPEETASQGQSPEFPTFEVWTGVLKER